MKNTTASFTALSTVLTTLIVLTACSLQSNKVRGPDEFSAHVSKNNQSMDSAKLPIAGLRREFKNPSSQYRPETWFHMLGNNISKEGLTRDLEAIKYAGMQGIHLFNKRGRPFPGVRQIKILSPEWESLVGHVADECERLGLKLTLQNCPGWSMAGGPWVPIEEAQREIVFTRSRLKGGQSVKKQLSIKKQYLGADFDYKDITLMAFPTPQDDDLNIPPPASISSNNPSVPWDKLINQKDAIDLSSKNPSENIKQYMENAIGRVQGDNYTWVDLEFDASVTLRSLTLPPLRTAVVDRQYPVVDVNIRVQAYQSGELVDIASLDLPSANWTDKEYELTLSVPETTARKFRLSFRGDHKILLSYLKLSSQARLHNHQAKASKVTRSLQLDTKQILKNEFLVPSSQVIDLSKFMDESGTLEWDAPKGDWTLLRFGHVNMRKKNKPAVPEATGWETSKLDKIAIENHLRKGMIGNLLREGGPIRQDQLHGLLIDSWESFVPTWTIEKEELMREFKRRRGYSMQPYLPATIGYVVDSVEKSNKFLRDLRATMDDLYIDNFFAHFRTVAHDLGAKVYTEGAGGEVLPTDPMRYYGVSDYPMTEFWFPKAPSSQMHAKPIFAASSATHLYNKPLLAAEACTQLGVEWDEHPYTVKYLIDKNFTKGVNHLVFHTFSHTPQLDVKPGSTFGGHIGFPLVRNQTWWQHTPEWMNYLSRTQFLLQQGEFVADVLWYLGDDLERHPLDSHPFPKSHKFDFLNEEILQSKLSMQNGKIHVKDAGTYRVIMLRNSERMLLSTAEKLNELVKGGAIILGNKPLRSPSLMDGAKRERKLKTIADAMWGEGESGVKRVGRGKVYWGMSIEQVLAKESISSDVSYADELDIDWIHRETEDAHIYFLSNQEEIALEASVDFRIGALQPELWNLHTGEQIPARVWQERDGKTQVALSFAPHGSIALVFSKSKPSDNWTKISEGSNTLLNSQSKWFKRYKTLGEYPSIHRTQQSVLPMNTGRYTLHGAGSADTKLDVHAALQTLGDPWQLSFEEGWGAPSNITLRGLMPLNEHANKGVRHYSGTVKYQSNFEFSSASKGNVQSVILDLGEVNNIAEVWLNGEKVQTLWAPPFTTDIKGNVKEGMNALEVRVTNTWRNQLIFDNTRPKNQKLTWTSNPPKKHEVELEASGLVGPVTIRSLSAKSL